jgi:hypothetical protein
MDMLDSFSIIALYLLAIPFAAVVGALVGFASFFVQVERERRARVRRARETRYTWPKPNPKRSAAMFGSRSI